MFHSIFLFIESNPSASALQKYSNLGGGGGVSGETIHSTSIRFLVFGFVFQRIGNSQIDFLGRNPIFDKIISSISADDVPINLDRAFLTLALSMKFVLWIWTNHPIVGNKRAILYLDATLACNGSRKGQTLYHLLEANQNLWNPFYDVSIKNTSFLNPECTGFNFPRYSSSTEVKYPNHIRYHYISFLHFSMKMRKKWNKIDLRHRLELKW